MVHIKTETNECHFTSYTNYKGERKQTQKRGFGTTKREAVAWGARGHVKERVQAGHDLLPASSRFTGKIRKRVKENIRESKAM